MKKLSMTSETQTGGIVIIIYDAGKTICMFNDIFTILKECNFVEVLNFSIHRRQ